jgi:hypothetical protein
MKKIFAIAVLGVITLSSCKKDYTCACTATDSSDNISIAYKGVKKKDAESTCDTYSTSYASVTPGGKCEIK